MYFLIVILFLLICPAASVAIEAARSHESLVTLALIGRWWTFWSVGIRLFIAGIRQVVQPSFTAEEIFGIRDSVALPFIREIGYANLSMGTLAISTIRRPDWVIPAAIVGSLYYGLAGLGHLPHKNKNAKENTAMLSDIFVAGLLAVFVLKTIF